MAGVRIAIIRGVWSSNPYAYAVVVGPNVDNLPLDGASTFELVSRFLRHDAFQLENLDRFLAEYNHHGRYLLAPAHLPSMNGTPKPMMDFALGKYHLTMHKAWEIGVNDPDSVALDADDPPVIPPDRTKCARLKGH